MRGPPRDAGYRISRVIAFFASDDSGLMTGTYAPVNGGLAMD
jgi:hypothetical protein